MNSTFSGRTFTRREEIQNSSEVKNIMKYFDFLNETGDNLNITISKTSTKWNRPIFSQIMLLQKALENEPTFYYLKYYQPKMSAFEIIDNNIYSLYQLFGPENKTIYARVLFWQASDNLGDKKAPELVSVTDKDPL